MKSYRFIKLSSQNTFILSSDNPFLVTKVTFNFNLNLNITLCFIHTQYRLTTMQNVPYIAHNIFWQYFCFINLLVKTIFEKMQLKNCYFGSYLYIFLVWVHKNHRIRQNFEYRPHIALDLQ